MPPPPPPGVAMVAASSDLHRRRESTPSLPPGIPSPAREWVQWHTDTRDIQLWGLGKTNNHSVIEDLKRGINAPIEVILKLWLSIVLLLMLSTWSICSSMAPLMAPLKAPLRSQMIQYWRLMRRKSQSQAKGKGEVWMRQQVATSELSSMDWLREELSCAARASCRSISLVWCISDSD